MSDAEEVWLVAGGEPGARRFGTLVQKLRMEKKIAVGDLAELAELSVGAIRAIEQARRAPSEESGVRLLRALLPEGSVATEVAGDDGKRADIAFTDPESGKRILVEFQAKTAGDNRRWASDRPRADESHLEALASRAGTSIGSIAAAVAAIGMVHSARTIQTLGGGDLIDRRSEDAQLGGIMRRLTQADEMQLAQVERLLDLWERVSSGVADDWEHAQVSEFDLLLSRQAPSTDEPEGS